MTNTDTNTDTQIQIDILITNTNTETNTKIQMTNTDTNTKNIYWTCQPAELWKRWTEEGKGFSPSLGLFCQNEKCQNNVSAIEHVVINLYSLLSKSYL